MFAIGFVAVIAFGMMTVMVASLLDDDFNQAVPHRTDSPSDGEMDSEFSQSVPHRVDTPSEGDGLVDPAALSHRICTPD